MYALSTVGLLNQARKLANILDDVIETAPGGLTVRAIASGPRSPVLAAVLACGRRLAERPLALSMIMGVEANQSGEAQRAFHAVQRAFPWVDQGLRAFEADGLLSLNDMLILDDQIALSPCSDGHVDVADGREAPALISLASATWTALLPLTLPALAAPVNARGAGLAVSAA